MAYDGNGRKNWHNGSASYAQEKWKPVDVPTINICNHMDNGQIRFSSNGKDLGVAFENINKNKRNNNDKKNTNKGDEMTIQRALTLWRQNLVLVYLIHRPPKDLSAYFYSDHQKVWMMQVLNVEYQYRCY